MKIKILLLSLLAATGFCNAANISLANYDGLSTFSLVGDSGLTLVTTGTITLGTYSAEPLTPANYLANFTAFGSSISFFGPSAPGYFTGGVSQSIAPASFFAGKQIYAIIESNGEVAVWKATSNPAGNSFIADDPIGGPSDVTVLTTTGTLLIGTIDNYNVPSFGSQPGITLAPIPEPSAALLGALGALGLLRRRRI